MAMEAWFMDESGEDQRLPHHRNPKEFVSLDYLADLGVLYWHLNPKDYENDEELQKIRGTRGYDYMDLLDLCPEKVDNNYEEKLRNFYTEHIHADEEIRYCLQGSAYFDVRDKDDRWIRIWIKEGDLIILPAGIYHRFTLDTTNYVKLMRLFVGEPVWTAYNRPQEDHPAREEYIKSFADKVVVFAANGSISSPLVMHNFILDIAVHLRQQRQWSLVYTLRVANKLMRLSIGDPVWTAYNRPQKDHPAREEYIKSFTDKVGVPLKAH